MASSGKKKTTMAKLTRERKLQERRLDKRAKKNARKQAPAHPPAQSTDSVTADRAELTGSDAAQTDPEPRAEVVPGLAEVRLAAAIATDGRAT